MTIKAVNNKIIVKLEEQENVTASGIILTDKQKKEPIGYVVSIGDKVTLVEESQKIFFDSKKAFRMNGEGFYCIEEDNVLAVLEEDG